MTELIIWIAAHPDVMVRFHKDSILNSFIIRVIKGRYISQHIMDALECQVYCSGDEKKRTDFMIEMLNKLYGEIEKEEERCE